MAHHAQITLPGADPKTWLLSWENSSMSGGKPMRQAMVDPSRRRAADHSRWH
jgi:hypothetical protein